MSTSTQDEKSPIKLYLPKFCVVPLEAREDKTLNDAAKIYLGELNVLSNKFDYLTYKDEQLAEMKGVSVRTIKNWHAELESRGFIHRHTWREHYKNPNGTGVLLRSKRKLYVIEAPSKKVAEGQEPALHSEGQESAPHCEGKKAAPIKETIFKEELENNNKPPADAAHAVVVFPCFDELEISQDMKVKLSSQMDQAKVQRLVQRVKAWSGRESDAKACNTILGQWETWEDTVSKEDLFEKNSAWANEKLRKYDNQDVGVYRCVVLSKHVEFCHSGVGQPTCFGYDSSEFQAEVTAFMNKNLKHRNLR